MPVLTGIERISPYTNTVDGGKLVRLTQASRTNTKVWRSREIMIPAPPDLAPLTFNSYTTTIVANSAHGTPECDEHVGVQERDADPAT